MISINTKTGTVTNVPDTIPLPTSAQLQAAADAETTAKAQIALNGIDARSVRAIREFILAKFAADALLAPELANYNAAAITERAKITPK